MEITHILDDDNRYIQVVLPETLKKILDDQGSGYDRPCDFNENDQWEVLE